MREDLQKKLDGFNGPVHEYDKSKTLVDQFCDVAGIYPDNTAVICRDKALTYKEVDVMSDILADELCRNGVKRGDAVAVLIGRSEAMVTASLGILKTGAAYVPLDPAYPDDRLSFMMGDASVKVLVTSDEFMERARTMNDGRALVVNISVMTETSDIRKMGTTSDETVKREPPKPEDLFMLIYTSGTTGIPKGVRILHKNIIAYVAWYRRFYKIAQDWKVSCYNSYGFDGSVCDMYPALTVGAGVVIIPEDIKLDLQAIADTVNSNGICLMDLPSQVARQFALTMNCPCLKYIVGGGERLAPFEPVHPYIVVNEYGPTEATVSVTAYCVTKYEDDYPIGVPNDNTAVYIVDENGERVDVGVKGELWVAGAQVTGGYLNRPEETKKAFIPNPFPHEKGYETVYKTGDLASFDPDGNIRFHGRGDGLVKIRGFRIELSEVEDVLRSHPDVREVAVTAWDAPLGGQFLAAYIVSDKPLDTAALSSYIQDTKPPYMVPKTFTKLDKIPLNQNGKLDRKALPKPEFKEDNVEYKAPKGKVQEEICRGFEVALGLEKVSASADFFELGGDSLSLMRLINECRDLMLSFKIVYDGRSAEGIDALLKERKSSTKLQKRDTHLLGPLHEVHYNWGNDLSEGYGLHCDALVTMDKKTDPGKLAGAIKKVLLAHPALDARLRKMPDGNLRWYLPAEGLEGYEIVPESLTADEFEGLKDSLRESRNRPEERMFVIRIFIVTQEDGSKDTILYFDFLHPIIDGDSIDIFMEDVDAAYRGEEIEEEKMTVLDYYDRIEDEIGTREYEQEIKWNKKFCASFTDKLCILPGDLDPGEENETLDIFEKLELDQELVDRFTAENNVTTSSLFSAAYGFMQAHCNKERAAVTLTIYNGRDDAAFSRTMGCIYRHHPLCVKFDDEISAVGFVKQTETDILKCRMHALYHADPVPLITAFSYQGTDLEDPFEFCGGAAHYEEVEDYEYEVFDFFVHRRADGFYVNLTYNSLAYSEGFISWFLKSYAHVITELISGVKPSEIGLVS